MPDHKNDGDYGPLYKPVCATSMVTTSLDQKYERMQAILRELKRVAVAYSAGVDSTLVLKVAIDTLGVENVLAVTGRSDSLARAEFDEARTFTATLAVEHVVIDTDEINNPGYAANPTDRCYYCKSTLFEQAKRLIEERGFNAVVSGTNADDYGDFRPGIDAGRELGVRAPAAEAGLTKNDIRALAERLGLDNHDKPASPCLSSRIPYGQRVTAEKLHMIEAAEKFLHELGIVECRVRHHGDLARIEVPAAWIPKLTEPALAARVDRQLREIGYQYVCLDLRGFRSGSLNDVIPLSIRTSANR